MGTSDTDFRRRFQGDPPSRPPRFYRVLLLAFPPEFRSRYGPSMEALFVDRLAAAGRLSRPGVWLRGVGDALRHGLAERRSLRRALRQAQRLEPGSSRGRTGKPLSSLGRDLRQAMRVAPRAWQCAGGDPHTGAGIGLTAAVWSIMYGVQLRPLPLPQPRRLVSLTRVLAGHSEQRADVTLAQFADWRAGLRSFADPAACYEDEATLCGGAVPERLHVTRVTPSLLRLLGVQPVLGAGCARMMTCRARLRCC